MNDDMITLETESLELGFDRQTGSLIRLYSKVSSWNILKRPELGLSWRMMLPLEGRRNNEAWGHKQQKAPLCSYSSTQVAFIWDGIVSEHGGAHAVLVETVCSVENGQAVFRMHLDNKDDKIIENVYYPYIGDLHRPANCETFQFEHGSFIGLKAYSLYPAFPNCAGLHSVDFPTLCVEDHLNPPMNPFGLFSDDSGNGLYLGVAERRLEAATWHGEYLPGWRNSNEFRVFEDDAHDGKENYFRFAVGHLPYIAPNTEFNLLAFSIAAYRGGWSVGAACYTKMSAAWSTLPTVPRWSRTPHAWMQLHINSPEDELRMQFKDLPRVGMECKKYGVKAIQLVGWNRGGQDRGNPCHSPDPRLGTFEELKNAIREIREMGVKLILFTKFTWAEQSIDTFESVYKAFSIKDPYQNYYLHRGFQYMTLSQMVNVNTRKLIPMCFGSQEYRAICRREFQKCLDLEPDGILFDECQHHSPTLCCFDTAHEHRYGAPAYTWDEQLIQDFRAMLGGREFMIAGEAIYDFQHNYYDLSYTRTHGREHKPMTRYLRPHGNIMTAVAGFHDRAMLNQCLLNRYIISYEPYNFKGMLSDFPSTVAYGQRVDRLRTELRQYFWDGAFCDKIGGSVHLADGGEHAFYAVYQGTNGKKGMVICNYDEENPIFVIPALDGGQKLTQYRLVDADTLTPFASGFTIPPSSAAAAIES